MIPLQLQESSALLMRIPILRRPFYQRNIARAERDQARSERDEAFAARDRAQALLDRAAQEREAAVAERDAVLKQLNRAVWEREAAAAERDAVLKQWAELRASGQRGDILARAPHSGTVAFQCNICGSDNTVPESRIGREIASCSQCGSTVRWRSIVYLLSKALHGRGMILPDFPSDPSITGAGLSDWSGYADPLEQKYQYHNTYFHQEPRLDITNPPVSMFGTLDFLISTEVFEHIPAPVSRAFQATFKLLKPGGHFIFSVPFNLDSSTVEHYPELQDFAVVEIGGHFCVVVKNNDGAYFLDSKPTFHGGPGQTLEMRSFCKRDIIRELNDAGFVGIEFLSEAVPTFGLYFPEPWSLPILARKPGGRLGGMAADQGR